ncbi:MAG: bifunctional phosphopantothenoylcysteine decarboxylase/phosphopantothenate--cysteine ligase CoaBC [bacterium]|nr:MAG: bifunctional phosphopantothenoylcysteine decarboxylase/phosphopantothenate--cysteine ligase CoaBC [bacterium]
MHGKKILLIVTGGIAAYKSAHLVRLLVRSGGEVRVVLTASASEFVTPLTFEVLSGNPVPAGLFAPRSEPGVRHVELATWAQRILVAPATADFLAKAAHGLADDLASTVLLAARCPVILAPAMNEGMWQNPAVRRNIDVLRGDGKHFIEPGSGALACGESGSGRMAEPEEIVRTLLSSFEPGDLAGVRFLISAGRTEEDIDPVRYLSNRSSGRMGFALAAEAKRRGAHITLVHGPVDVEPPDVDACTRVRNAARMKAALSKAFPRCNVLIMAAAVADFTPVTRADAKIRRVEGNLSLELKPTPDILAILGARKKKEQVVVGFALETGGGGRFANEKARRKACDYLVLNRVGERTGFSVETNQISVFKDGRKVLATGIVSKEEAAAAIIGQLAADVRLRRMKR